MDADRFSRDQSLNDAGGKITLFAPHNLWRRTETFDQTDKITSAGNGCRDLLFLCPPENGWVSNTDEIMIIYAL